MLSSPREFGRGLPWILSVRLRWLSRVSDQRALASKSMAGADAPGCVNSPSSGNWSRGVGRAGTWLSAQEAHWKLDDAFLIEVNTEDALGLLSGSLLILNIVSFCMVALIISCQYLVWKSVTNSQGRNQAITNNMGGNAGDSLEKMYLTI